MTESQLTKCPTEPIISLTAEKGKEFGKNGEMTDPKASDPLEHESLLADNKKDSENIENTSTLQ